MYIFIQNLFRILPGAKNKTCSTLRQMIDWEKANKKMIKHGRRSHLLLAHAAVLLRGRSIRLNTAPSG
jgi:hypothetical protein